MDPVTLVIVPGVLGGLVLAFVVVLSRRRARPAPSVMLPYRRRARTIMMAATMGANTVLSIDQPADPDLPVGKHRTKPVKLASAT